MYSDEVPRNLQVHRSLLENIREIDKRVTDIHSEAGKAVGKAIRHRDRAAQEEQALMVRLSEFKSLLVM